jgi:hypothetical protein
MGAYPNVDRKYKRNRRFVNSKGFVDYMIANIPEGSQFRIHVSGDFFSVEYVKKWIEIVTARPDVTFYAYTRSWREWELWEHIRYLHFEHDNVTVNLSVDDETGSPLSMGYDKYWFRQMRWAYLTKTDNVPDWIRTDRDDVVFRSNSSGHKIRRANAKKKGLNPDDVAPLVKRLGARVCVVEQGQKIPGMTCKKCSLCVDKPKVPANAM